VYGPQLNEVQLRVCVNGRVRPTVLVQAGLTGVVLARLARGRERRPPLTAGGAAPSATVSVIVPARDEAERIGAVLTALAADPDVLEVLVVDDHSTDATAAVAAAHGARVLPAPPLPEGWVGKPWALQHGLEQAAGEVVVTLDADVRPESGLVRALVTELLAQPARTLLTGTVRFACETRGERALHPAFLATLVYRFGPGDVDAFQPRPSRAVANGQCLAARREELLAARGFGLAAPNMTDDVALARALRARGWCLHTVDAADLLEVRMYDSAGETWRGWSRSLMAPEVTSPAWQALDVATLWAVQALPLPRLLLRRGSRLDWLLLVLRLALHGAFRRTYRHHDAAFWVAPLLDLPAVARLTWSVLRPERRWRGRTY
jgi:dolichol-phosphate mannosyltransferase